MLNQRVAAILTLGVGQHSNQEAGPCPRSKSFTRIG